MATSHLTHSVATSPGDTRRRWSPSRAGTAASFAAAGALLWWTFHSVDLGHVGSRLASARGGLGLVLLAYLLPVTCDTFAWRRLLAGLGRAIPFRRLIGVRVSVEAMHMSLPAGSIVGEALTAPVLRARCQTPLADGTASIAARKCLIGLAHGAFVLSAAAMGRPLIDAAARHAQAPWLPAAFYAVAVVLFVLATTGVWFLISAEAGARVGRLLQALPIERLRQFVATRTAGFSQFDAGASGLLRTPRTLLLAGAFLLMWLAQAFETWLLLRVLQAPVSFAQALPIEAAATVLRLAGLVVPGGLGVQEAGYAALIAGTGLPEPAAVAAAFAVGKRLKEAAWTSVGYALLARTSRAGVTPA